ncbi:MAG TPA: hypothetical protein VH370_11430 [Humisphaera sp.]|nr:hypothetical protein [Humisphaera sp.]
MTNRWAILVYLYFPPLVAGIVASTFPILRSGDIHSEQYAGMRGMLCSFAFLYTLIAAIVRIMLAIRGFLLRADAAREGQRGFEVMSTKMVK